MTWLSSMRKPQKLPSLQYPEVTIATGRLGDQSGWRQAVQAAPSYLSQEIGSI